jgi:hypothetical protein
MQEGLKEIFAAIDIPLCALVSDLPNREAAARMFWYPSRVPSEWFSFFDSFALSNL